MGEYDKKTTTSEYIGVTYRNLKWHVQRYNKNEKKNVYYGSYDNEETAAHASDTLARKFMTKGEQGHKLNFPDDHTEVHHEEKIQTSEHIGVRYRNSKWYAQRWSKNEKKLVYYGCHDNEETAAHASDTLARELLDNGEQGHKLNFIDDQIEVHPEKIFTSQYIGVTYNNSKWHAQRWSKNEKTNVYYGSCENEETAAHASDTLARILMSKGEQGHKLNFPDDHTEVQPKFQKKKRKRHHNFQDK